MDREEARAKVLQIMRLLKGHPPPDPLLVLDQIDEVIHPPKKRKETKGRDRMDTGGNDRSED